MTTYHIDEIRAHQWGCRASMQMPGTNVVAEGKLYGVVEGDRGEFHVRIGSYRFLAYSDAVMEVNG